MKIPTFETEQNEIFTSLCEPIFNLWKNDIETQKNILKEVLGPDGTECHSLELIITPYCNQACEYCYLYKHGKDLYPPEIADNKTIIKNLYTILDYCLEQGFQFKTLDLFTGEIWGYPFGNQVLDIIMEYIKKGLKIREVVIPSNCSFCYNEKLLEVVNTYIFKFAEMSCWLGFSISIDGPLLDKKSRPIKGAGIDKSDEYYESIYRFARQHGFGFHPMIAAADIESQIENYDSWIEIIKKMYPEEKSLKDYYGIIMQLEVREKEWTNEKIFHYLNWLNHLIDTDVEVFFDGNKKALMDRALFGELYGAGFFSSTYIPYNIAQYDSQLNCSLTQSFCVRLGDLAIVPCHRTSYKKLILGRFTKDENGKINGLEGENIALANSILNTGFGTKPFCNECLLNNHCIKYCCGANYETSGELFYPVEENCKLQKAKAIFLYEKYKKMGVEEYYGKERMDHFFADYIELEGVEKEWTDLIRRWISEI